MMEFIIQFVNHTNGERSQEFIATATKLHETLKDHETYDPDDHILVIARVNDSSEDQPELEFVRTPIMTIRSFLAAHDQTLENNANG